MTENFRGRRRRWTWRRERVDLNMRQIVGHIYDDGKSCRLNGAETFSRDYDNDSGAAVRNSQHGEGQRNRSAINEQGGRRKENVSLRDSAAG